MLKLLNRKTRLAEVKRLTGLKNPDSEAAKMTLQVFEQRMADVRVVRCPQKSGRPYYLVMAKRGDNWFGFKSKYRSLFDDEYPNEGLESLFAARKPDEPENLTSLDQVNAERVEGYELSFFNADGREHHLFGRNNYISSGYLLDMNGDGVLERMDATNWGVLDDYSVKSIKVKTVETKPQTLLHVVYEWHPSGAPECNEWAFAMRDVNSDGYQDVVLGPKVENTAMIDRVAVTYLWDQKKNAFVGPDGTKGDHYRRLFTDGVEVLKKSGGLGYTVVKDESEAVAEGGKVTRAEVLARPLHALPDFKSMSMEQLLHFFGSGKTQQSKNQKGFPTVFPKGMESMSAKVAALAYAEANRTAAHRKAHRLAVDDRNGVAPPKKGWMVFTQHSSGCYTYIEWLWAISLEEKCLVYCANSSNGVVGSNPFLDETGYDIRVIALKDGEAEYLAGVLWWLDRIRSKPLAGADSRASSMSSTADGGCAMYEFDSGKTTSHFRGKTVWFGFAAGPSSRWQGDYTQTVCGNLAANLCTGFLPGYLGQRWSRYAVLEHHNLTTSDQQKMKGRHDDGQLQIFRRDFKKVFNMHAKVTAPAEVLGWMARAAGDIGLHEFEKELMRLDNSLKPDPAAQKELAKLKNELKGKRRPFVFEPEREPAKAALTKKFDRLDALEERQSMDFHAYLRQHLKSPLRKLAVANDAGELTRMALEGGGDAYWAQRHLRRKFPSEYGDVLVEMFRRARDAGGKEQALELLIAFSPGKAVELVSGMTEADRKYFCLSLVALYQKKLPDRMSRVQQRVVAKARDKESTWQHRHRAVRMLVPEIFPQGEKMIYPVLVAIASEKKQTPKGVYNPHPHSACVASMIRWPRARTEWQEVKRIAALRTGQSWDESSVVAALVGLSVHCGPSARKEVQQLLEERLLNGSGLVESQIEFIFKNGYRECLPLIERMATANPEEKQNRWAVMGQSGAAHPTGRYSYHAARQLRALWGDYDSATAARMWTAKALQSPELFVVGDQDTPKQGKLNRLGQELGKKLMAEKDIRDDFLQRAESHPAYYRDHLAIIRKELAR